MATKPAAKAAQKTMARAAAKKTPDAPAAKKSVTALPAEDKTLSEDQRKHDEAQIDKSAKPNVRAEPDKKNEKTDPTAKKQGNPTPTLATAADPAAHEQWRQNMLADGWTAGDEFNVEKRTDPRLKPWNELQKGTAPASASGFPE